MQGRDGLPIGKALKRRNSETLEREELETEKERDRGKERKRKGKRKMTQTEERGS